MITTHLVVLLGQPAALLQPASALLPFAGGVAVVGNGKLAARLIPALLVRAGPGVLPLRER